MADVGQGFRLLLVGATGAVGRDVLRLALVAERVVEVVAPTRRPLPPAAGLTNPVVDFARLDPEAPWWAVEGVVCALGTTIRKAGSKAAFAAVDRDLPVEVARLARLAGATRFALTSSVGASPKGGFYLRTKAEAEAGVGALGYPSLTIVRPSLLVAEREESRPAERLGILVARALRPLIPRRYRAVPTVAVARALLKAVVVGRHGVHVLESEAL